MKTAIIVTVLSILSTSVPAQTSRSKADLRIVDGKVYNAPAAPGWETIPAEFQNGTGQSCTVAKVLPEGIACDIEYSEYTEARGLRGGHLKYILVKNHPRKAALISGNSLDPFRAMLVGRAQLFGDTVAVYDCGTPYQAPPPTASEELAAQLMAEQQKEAADKRKAAADAAALKFHLERAAEGDAISQRRLVELYTQRGDTNAAAAWLRAAATNAPPN